MKIQEQMRTSLKGLPNIANDRPAANAANFQNIMASHRKEITENHFIGLLKEVDEQGKRLSENPNFTELRKYKSLVQKFIEEATNKGVGLYQSESWDSYGGNKTLKTVRILDQQLMDLTNEVLQQNHDSLAILDRIGEIKGLLINLYR